MVISTDALPYRLARLAEGVYAYRYGQAVKRRVLGESVTEDGAPSVRDEWTANEVRLEGLFTANDVVRKVIAEEWPDGYEQKLANEYLAATLGMVSEEESAKRKERYQAFLTERDALKTEIDTFFAEHLPNMFITDDALAVPMQELIDESDEEPAAEEAAAEEAPAEEPAAEEAPAEEAPAEEAPAGQTTSEQE